MRIFDNFTTLVHQPSLEEQANYPLDGDPGTKVPRPDNLVFKLHYKFTFALLALCSALVGTYKYIDTSDSAIQCMLDKKSPISGDVINRFCWMQSTFSLPKYYEGTQGIDFIYPGVGPYNKEDEQVYHAYYQWVPLMLLFQAVCFYAPHWIWKQAGGNRVRNIINGINRYENKTSEEDREIKVRKLADYMKRLKELKAVHITWYSSFFVCECLNFLNVIGQIFLTDVFLGGEFTKYGIEVIQFAGENPEDRIDAMSKVFPRVTKCTFHKYGSSGTLQRLDALCMLGVNILNEKIYVFLWFWFVILAIITGINLVLRFVQICLPDKTSRLNLIVSNVHLAPHVQKSHLEAVLRNTKTYADWFILSYLADSMAEEDFGLLVKQMALDIDPPGYQTPSTEEDDSDLRESGMLKSPH